MNIQKFKNIIKPIYTLLSIGKSELFKKFKKVNLPVIVNFNANDICNSKCGMCNIWQQKQDYEISPSEFENLLRNPLYRNVKHIGITGGEPTLRDDLPALYKSAIRALPGVDGLSIITNAIKADDVIKRIEDIVEICKEHGKNFSMMVSLDGYRGVHDRVRGKAGNFDSAVKVIEHFLNQGVNVSTGTTISKINVWDVDELLRYFKIKGWYGRFRVAEFINRLYNNTNIDVIRNFDEDEKYHLSLFFYKLINSYETDVNYIRTYKSIINVLSGGKRLIGCPYHTDGLVVNSRGELAYCAPKSKIIGNGIRSNSLRLFKKNLVERKRIMKEDCDSCIHDYHAPITFKEQLNEYKEFFWRRIIRLGTSTVEKVQYFILPEKSDSNKKRVFIIGWYGTETVGDKAILAGIILDLKNRYGSFDLTIGSLYPIITERTVKELEIEARVINVYSKDLIRCSKSADIVVMGGGPLMDLGELAIPLHAFRIGKSYNKINIIYGCGLGPLTEVKYINAVKEILNLSTEIKLRDYKSIQLAQEWVSRDINISHSGDPAKIYLAKYLNKSFKSKEKNKVIRCFLREWTYEYSKDISLEEFFNLRKQFEQSLARYIINKAKEFNADEVVFEHMHNFVIGNDDRDFSRYFIDKYLLEAPIKISYNKYLSTVDSIVSAMEDSNYNICMRFHSVVFAHTLNTSFIAIDYTKGGKILNYLKDNQADEYLLSISDLISKY